MWGYESLEGRRSVDVSYFDLPPRPPKAPKGASEVEKARAKKALKAYNKIMRPAQGTALHAIWEAYYLQRVPGAWHPPMPWRSDADIAAAWHSRPGQIAMSGRGHMPDPKSLAAVWCEELVSLEGMPPGLLVGGTPDLVTAVRELAPPHLEGYAITLWAYRFHLYDYKSTVSIDDYAKTAAELLEDEQAAIYSLAVMQKHGLTELDCTWLYFQTDETKPARSLPVRFTMTRAHAEEVIARIVEQALKMADVQARYLAERPGLLGRRLEIIKALDTNDMACDNFAGCPFHHKRPGGICKPRKSTLGEALNKQALEKRKTTGRREAAQAAKAADKERGRDIMAMTTDQTARMAELVGAKAAAEGKGEKLKFNLAQELLKLTQKAAAEAPLVEEGGTEEVETTGEEVPEAKPVAAATPKPAAPAKAKAAPEVAGDVACVTFAGVSVPLPKTSPLHKAVVKICNAQKALDAAVAGE